MATKPHIDLSSAQSELRATVANALAEALINGIDNAASSNHPLTLLQQQELATMTIMAYSNALDGCENLEIQVSLEKARDERRT